jgi:hypothetical protein
MAELRRARRPAPARERRRSPGATLVSLALHGVLAVVLGRALEIHAPFVAFFARDVAPPAAERVTYVATRVAPSPEPEGGGDGRARTPGAAPPAPRLMAPPTVPTGVPDAPPAAEPAPAAPAAPERVPGDATAGRGLGQGSGVGDLTGPAAGLRPTYTGPTVWQRPESPYAHPVGVAEKLDSMIAGDLGAVRDSIAAAEQMRKPGDWTFERNGRTYGIDQRFIRLGKFSLPTAILGLLPLNQQANPSELERGRRLGPEYAESRAQGLRRAADEEFKDVVKSIRERKERERNERRARVAAQGRVTGPPVGATPAAPPPER